MVIFLGVRMMDREAALNALIVTILIGLVSTGIYLFIIYVPHGGVITLFVITTIIIFLALYSAFKKLKEEKEIQKQIAQRR